MYQDFSSMPPDQEREFIVFEQRSRDTSKSAFTIGAVTAAIYGLLVVVIVMSHDKPQPLIEADDIAQSRVMDEAPAPAAVPVVDPTAEPTADEAAAADTLEAGDAPEAAEAEAAGAATPPPPPPGATKAPPTAVVGQ